MRHGGKYLVFSVFTLMFLEGLAYAKGFAGSAKLAGDILRNLAVTAVSDELSSMIKDKIEQKKRERLREFINQYNNDNASCNVEHMMHSYSEYVYYGDYIVDKNKIFSIKNDSCRKYRIESYNIKSSSIKFGYSRDNKNIRTANYLIDYTIYNFENKIKIKETQSAKIIIEMDGEKMVIIGESRKKI